MDDDQLSSFSSSWPWSFMGRKSRAVGTLLASNY